MCEVLALYFPVELSVMQRGEVEREEGAEGTQPLYERQAVFWRQRQTLSQLLQARHWIPA